MKKLIAMVLAAMAIGFVHADNEEISMEEKEIQTVTIPFGIRTYAPSNKDVVRIEKVSDTSIRLTALKQGRCDLEVRGELDMVAKYQILVGSPITRKLNSLQRRLERVPEVHAQIVDDKIDINGEIKSIEKWNLLMKVVEGYPKDLVNNFVKFVPGPELMLRIKDSLQQCGFAVVFGQKFEGDWNTWKGNTVAISDSPSIRTLLIQAKVYTPEQAKMIEECFKSQKFWLKIDNDDQKSFDDEKQYRGRMMVYVAKPMIRLSVAYMAVSDEDINTFGNNAARNGQSPLSLNGTFQTIQNLLHGGGNHGNIASVQANLTATAEFLKENNISTISETGYTLMESWDKDGAHFKSGGTTFIKVAGADAADLKEIPYGFDIKAKGGMTDDANMAVDFDFGLSTVEQTAPDAYDRKEDISKQHISCQVGRTTLIGGFRKFADEKTLRGLPVLRNTPIFSWFVAADDGSVRDRKLIVMVCPEIVDNTVDYKPDVNRDINIPVRNLATQPTSKTLEERKPYTGFWSWLNWFQF